MNAERSRALATLATRYLPGLALSGGTAWAGHRPATPDSLPVIGRSPRHSQVFYAFGHGHLGLTQAATTGRLVADLLLGRRPPIDPRPYGIERFDWPLVDVRADTPDVLTVLHPDEAARQRRRAAATDMRPLWVPTF
jgi:glycine/D-amino acid oxidase-like deaminating enzyme